MQVTISQFRARLFDLVNQAMAGEEVWVSHKGGRFKLTPEKRRSKMSRLTRVDFICGDIDDPKILEEMTKEWESDWKDL